MLDRVPRARSPSTAATATFVPPTSTPRKLGTQRLILVQVAADTWTAASPARTSAPALIAGAIALIIFALSFFAGLVYS